MDAILFNSSGSESEDESSNLDGKDTTVSTVAAIVQKEQEKQAAAAKAEAEAAAQNAQMMKERQEQERLLERNPQQLKLQQQEALAKKEKECQATSTTTTVSKQPMSISRMRTYSGSGNITQSNVMSMNTNPNVIQNTNIAKYGIRTPTLPASSQPMNIKQTHPISQQHTTSTHSVPITNHSLTSGLPSNAFEPTPFKDLFKGNRTTNNSKPTTTQMANITSTSPNRTHPHSSSQNQRRHLPLSQSQPTKEQFKAKQEKDRFLLFTKVLIRYLEQKDKEMFHRAKSVIRECAEKNKSKDPQYLSLTKSMQVRLRATVGPDYWRKAEEYLNHFLAKKKALKEAANKSSSNTIIRPATGIDPNNNTSTGKPAPTYPTTGPATTTQQQQQQQQMTKMNMQPHSRSSNQLSGIQTTKPNQSYPTPSNQRVSQPPLPSNVMHTQGVNVAPGPSQVTNPLSRGMYKSTYPPASGITPTNTALLQKSIKKNPVKPPPKKIVKPKPTTIIKNNPKTSKQSTNIDLLNDRTNQIIANMTPAQHRAHLAARNVALGIDNSSTNTNSQRNVVPNASNSKSMSATLSSSNAVKSSQHYTTNPNNLKHNSVLPSVGKTNVVNISNNNKISSHSSIVKPTVMPTNINAQRQKKQDSSKNRKSIGSMDDLDGGNITKLGGANVRKVNVVGSGISYPLPGSQAGQVDINQNKEYEELMEQLDHASLHKPNKDVLLVQKEILMEEQKKLLYDQTELFDWSRMKTITAVNEKSTPGGVNGVSVTSISNSNFSNNHWQMQCKGWGKHNVVSSSMAWARLRLLEEEELEYEEKQNKLLHSPSSNKSYIALNTSYSSKKVSTKYSWFNDEKAEEDQTLALISEATQIYIKSLLKGAISSARQRNNLDASRLWYAQYGPETYPLTLRIGCDVKRQIALSSGNAAKTCQRLEEALTRSSSSNYEYTEEEDDKMLYLTTSMYDLSKYPTKRSNAANEAEQDAKRSFEVYGGKHSREPPFGRVPAKKCKVLVNDFKSVITNAAFPWKSNGFTASNFI